MVTSTWPRSVAGVVNASCRGARAAAMAAAARCIADSAASAVCQGMRGRRPSKVAALCCSTGEVEALWNRSLLGSLRLLLYPLLCPAAPATAASGGRDGEVAAEELEAPSAAMPAASSGWAMARVEGDRLGMGQHEGELLRWSRMTVWGTQQHGDADHTCPCRELQVAEVEHDCCCQHHRRLELHQVALSTIAWSHTWQASSSPEGCLPPFPSPPPRSSAPVCFTPLKPSLLQTQKLLIMVQLAHMCAPIRTTSQTVCACVEVV